jgi:HK97 gp10 family phage protein
MSIKFEGLESIEDKLYKLKDVKSYENALKKACMLVERTAKQKAPKGNGELRRSITSRIDKDGNELKGVVFTPLEYAPYVEYGTGLFAEEQGRQDVPWHYKDDEGNWHSTSGMPPHPYLRPALYENREEILRLLKEGIK